MSGTLKLCKDCIHFDHLLRYCCQGKKQIGINPVNGTAVYNDYVKYASEERAAWAPWRCVKSGRHFESKANDAQ